MKSVEEMARERGKQVPGGQRVPGTKKAKT
jgi:hypothetical protein